MSSAQRFGPLLEGLKAAAEDTRLRLLALLGEAELTVSDLTEILGQSQPRISRPLQLRAWPGAVGLSGPARRAGRSIAALAKAKARRSARRCCSCSTRPIRCWRATA